MSGTAVTGTLYKNEGWPSGTLAGEGYFIALTFGELPQGATSAKVGLVPSKSGMDMQTLDSDMDAVFKISDKNRQQLRVDVVGASKTTTTLYDLSGLTLLKEKPEA